MSTVRYLFRILLRQHRKVNSSFSRIYYHKNANLKKVIYRNVSVWFTYNLDFIARVNILFLLDHAN